MNHPCDSEIAIFSSIPPPDLEGLLAGLRQVRLPADLVLFTEGDCGDSLYIVLEGELDIIKSLGTPEERLLVTRKEGELFGEMALLDPLRIRTASVVTRTPVRLLVMDRSEFDALLRDWPSVAYDLAQILSCRLRETNDATVRDLKEKNLRLEKAYRELQEAQARLIEQEKLKQELLLAWEIQQSMLPRTLPCQPGYEFGARIAPAHVVGGDFYDFIELDRNLIGIAVGDVSGKGLPAAIFMAMTRSLVRAEARKARSPREALWGVNKHLLEMNDSGMFVTVLYGMLNLEAATFDYGRAGHELPIQCDRRGVTTSPCCYQGQPLGIFSDPDIDEQLLQLSPGDTLLLFTDGLTDSFDEQGRAFGLNRLCESLGVCCSVTAQSVCDRLVDQVLDHQRHAPQHDDILVVAIRPHQP